MKLCLVGLNQDFVIISGHLHDLPGVEKLFLPPLHSVFLDELGSEDVVTTVSENIAAHALGLNDVLVQKDSVVPAWDSMTSVHFLPMRESPTRPTAFCPAGVSVSTSDPFTEDAPTLVL